MSGLAAVLAGDAAPGVYRWHGASDAQDVARAVELAGWRFGHVDGWTGAATKAEFLAAVGDTLAFPDHYGHNLDALADCLRDVARATPGVLLLWDGWSTLARADDRAFTSVLGVLRSRAAAAAREPFAVLLRGEGPDLDDVPTLA